MKTLYARLTIGLHDPETGEQFTCYLQHMAYTDVATLDIVREPQNGATREYLDVKHRANDVWRELHDKLWPAIAQLKQVSKSTTTRKPDGISED